MLIMTQNMAQNSQAHLYTYGLCIKVAECNDYISHVDYGITRESDPCTSPHTNPYPQDHLASLFNKFRNIWEKTEKGSGIQQVGSLILRIKNCTAQLTAVQQV